MRPFIDNICKKRKLTESETEQIPTDVFLEQLKQIFLPYFSQAYLDENLVLPEAFLIYLETVKGMLHSSWLWYADKDMVLFTTRGFCSDFYGEDFLERKNEGTSQINDTIWVKFGEWSDKHDWIICCDKSHPDFGKVFDCWDDHPWWHGDEFLSYEEFDSFMEFILKNFA
jgi:hypothetical protein